MTEDDIIRLIRSGGRSAERGVKELYREMAPALLRSFRSRGASPEEARDLLQDTIINIVRGAASYSGNGKAKAWIWQIARNCQISSYRRKSRRLEDSDHSGDWSLEDYADPSPDAPTTIAASSLQDCVDSGLRRFAKKMPERAYVLTLYMDELTIEEISIRIDRTVAATKEYLSQCRKKLQPFIAHCTELLEA